MLCAFRRVIGATLRGCGRAWTHSRSDLHRTSSVNVSPLFGFDSSLHTPLKHSILDVRNTFDVVLPVLNRFPLLDYVPRDSSPDVDCPADARREEKRAERLIVIRRRKMRRHKLRKLRRRQKYEVLKRNQRREIKKEKRFQRRLMDQIGKAERFVPERYIHGKLCAARRKPLPNYWKGKRLPKFIIRQLLGLDPKIDYKGIPLTQD